MTSMAESAGSSPEELGDEPTVVPASTTPATPESDGEQVDTDRPGDVPFEQAAAEHENPALE
ncbi:hypothetical protein [Leifsonia poae]|uniref:hypothetical protein n=1 Tax=Leifsonia poae TaxID=110933 RepID=UPI001CBFBD79|nr:hypothetical protein [Leifsonia poae]